MLYPIEGVMHKCLFFDLLLMLHCEVRLADILETIFYRPSSLNVPVASLVFQSFHLLQL
jgi:hypothetical protein